VLPGLPLHELTVLVDRDNYFAFGSTGSAPEPALRPVKLLKSDPEGPLTSGPVTLEVLPEICSVHFRRDVRRQDS
jgi:hypothetical protein